MLNPVDQIGISSPQAPVALLCQRPADDWLLAEPRGLGILSAPRAAAVAHPLSRVPLTFLRRLAVDDRLRAELETDPTGTLARHGVHVPPEAIPAAVSLPSPATLDRALRLHATAEDESSAARYFGLLGGGLLDGLSDD